MKKKIIIISGGMDSTTLLYDVVKKYGNKNIIALSFDYGSKHNSYELPLAQKSCKKLGVEQRIINVKNIFNQFNSALLKHKDSEAIPEGHYEDKSMKKTVVPFRNGILLSIAAGLAESIMADTVFYGAHGGDHIIYPDCRIEFEKTFSSAASLGTFNKIKIKAPYRSINKIGILKKGIKLKVPYQDTHTCYNPSKKGESCGKCGACQERLEAFNKLNIKDPKKYV